MPIPDYLVAYDYERARDFAKTQIDKAGHGFKKDFCEKNRLTYPSVVGLISGNISYKAPELLMRVLCALGYEVILQETSRQDQKQEGKLEKDFCYYIGKTC